MMLSKYDNPYRRLFASSVRALIFVNICVFMVFLLLGRLNFWKVFALVPPLVLKRGMIWQLVTYLFIHGGFMHLFINMYSLFVFGSVLEEMWGARKFFVFYFFTGIGAGLFCLVTSLGKTSAIIGASGAIFGIFVAVAILFPESIIYIFFIFPAKMKHAIWFFIALNLLEMFSSHQSGTAYMAHLGGAFCGYIYMKSAWIQEKASFLHPEHIKDVMRQRAARKRTEQKERLEQEVDRILEKVSRRGIHSLTRSEKEILNRRSRMP